MKSKVAYEEIVTTCGRCHEEKSVSLKYGFSTQIIKRYNESFHGKKYHLGGKNLPVCTTCHGSHDIRSQKDPEAPVYGENKIALCGQCHKGANEKFVAAITHKPIGKNNPIPYYTEKGLIILTICVISGCALHILIQIYASIRGALRARRRMTQ
jgi:cytochrome c553